MAANAKKCVLLVDSGKLGKTAFCNLDVLERLDYVITDAAPDRETAALFEKNGVISDKTSEKQAGSPNFDRRRISHRCERW